MTSHLHLLSRCAICLAISALLAGCGADETQSPTALKLSAIGKVYLDRAISWDNRGPANDKEFKKHIKGLPDHVINGYGMDPKAIDETFVSARDQEPFVILYGVKITEISGKEAPLVAHEKKGKNGRYLVGFANGKVREVDEATLQELKTEKK